ncbi:MAG: GAF domain-containing protein [Anaerolineales bacterium]|nr:GAF domain-containing protein [Anaerolineales bacterium]
MLVTRATSVISDSRRDADKYYKLLLAIESATKKIGALEKTGRASIDEVLAGLLPDLVDALDAAQAFVAVHQIDNNNQVKGFDLVASHPKMEASDSFLPWSKLLDQVLSDGKARVVGPFEDAPKKLIHGLEICNATTAILVRMQIGNQARIVGVCNRANPEMGPFLASDRKALESIIELIAIGLRMGERRRQELEAVINASKVITASVGLSRQEILERILEQAVETIKGSGERKATLGTMQLLDEKNKELVFECAYPPDIFSELKVEIGNRLPMEVAKNEGRRRGISVRAANSREPQLVDDVNLDPDYVVYYAKTRSELAVPLLDEGGLIGVLDVENDQVHAFDEEDVQALQALADMAVVALNNAKGAGELSFANTVASMGAWGAEIAHDVNRETGAIQRKLYLLKQEFPALSPDIKKTLEDIEQYAKSLVLPPLPKRAPKPGEVFEIKNAASLDATVASYIESIKSSHPGILLNYDLNCVKLRVSIHEQWLRRVLRHLVRNAIRSTEEREIKRVVVHTSIQGDYAKIEVEDTGKGVRSDILPMLFQQPIPHPEPENEKDGQGLLIVRFLAERHGGKIDLSWNRPGEGACFYFTVPFVRQSILPLKGEQNGE